MASCDELVVFLIPVTKEMLLEYYKDLR